MGLIDKFLEFFVALILIYVLLQVLIALNFGFTTLIIFALIMASIVWLLRELRLI